MIAVQRGSFFSHIFVGIFATVLLAVLAAGVLTERLLGERVQETLLQDVHTHARSLTVTLDPTDLESDVQRLGKVTDRRVTVMQFDGTVVAESALEPDRLREMENHAGRPEVRQAMKEGWGWEIRRSATVNEGFLYVAVRDDERRRVVRLAVPLENVAENLSRVRTGVLLALLAGTLVAALVAFLIARRLSSGVRGIARVARARANGERLPFPQGETDEFQSLAAALEKMARQLDAQLDDLDDERNRLRTMLETMTEGVTLCDEEGRIVLTNEAFLPMFGLSQPPLGHSLLEVARVPEAIALVERMPRARGAEICDFDYQNRSIQATFAPLRGLHMGGFLAVFHDITELRRADRIRRDFVANVSHELRTPLASIAGYAESLLDGAIEDPEFARTFLEGIGRNAERLSRLIEDLLDLARIESGRYSLQPQAVSVVEAVENAASVVGKLSAKQHRFVNEVTADVQVWADPKALSQILVNYVENAAKYSPPGTEIRVTADRQGDRTTIRVQDRGPGIPPEDLPRIFERFFRGDKSRNAAGEGGTGLGLAICKHLATEMGGKVGAESTGQGTTVLVELPARKPRSTVG